jgi:hypothetical protein
MRSLDFFGLAKNKKECSRRKFVTSNRLYFWKVAMAIKKKHLKALLFCFLNGIEKIVITNYGGL